MYRNVILSNTPFSRIVDKRFSSFDTIDSSSFKHKNICIFEALIENKESSIHLVEDQTTNLKKEFQDMRERIEEKMSMIREQFTEVLMSPMTSSIGAVLLQLL
jgi:peptidoglycan hydrolase CwlO-like protein